MKKNLFKLTICILAALFFLPTAALAQDSEHPCCLVLNNQATCSVCGEIPADTQPVQNHIHMTINENTNCIICGKNMNTRDSYECYYVTWTAYGTERSPGNTSDTDNNFTRASLVATNKGWTPITCLDVRIDAYDDASYVVSEIYDTHFVGLYRNQSYEFDVYSPRAEFDRLEVSAGVIQDDTLHALYSTFSLQLM